MSHSKNSTKGSFQRDVRLKVETKHIGYAFEGVSSIDGKRFFKRYVGKINRRALNRDAREEI